MTQRTRRLVQTQILPTASSEFHQYLAEKQGYVLGLVEFHGDGAAAARSGSPGQLMISTSTGFSRDVPFVRVNLPPGNIRSVTEVWTSSLPVTYGRIGRFNFAVDGENLFGSTSAPDSIDRLERQTEEIYDALFECTRILHYRHPIRIWNFVPNINADDPKGLERYKGFSVGRSVSFQKNSRRKDDEPWFPAGTGIGSFGGDIAVYFLSTAHKNHVHLENPRQVPAYKYPAQYGPKSPSFARATHYDRGEGRFDIYVSGTASVLGSESAHKGDIQKQLDTTFENLEILLGGENLAGHGLKAKTSAADMDWIKVYIRHKEHFEIIQAYCERYFSTKKHIAYLHADLCRHELDVEIEGIVSSSLG